MRYGHRDLAVRELGYKEDDCFIMKNGRGVVLNDRGCRLMTEKEKIKSQHNYIQERKPLALATVEERKHLSDSGVLLIQIDQDKGKLKSINYRPLGFLVTDKKDSFFQELDKLIKPLWAKAYDASRPTSAVEKQIKERVDHFILKFLNLRTDPIVEVVVC